MLEHFICQVGYMIITFPWPLLIANLRISAFIWQRTAFKKKKIVITQLLPPWRTLPIRLTTSELPCRTPATHFLALGDSKCFIFHFLRSDMFLGIVNLPWRQLTAMYFWPTQSRLVNSNTRRASSMQGLLTNHLRLQKDGRIVENSIKLT